MSLIIDDDNVCYGDHDGQVCFAYFDGRSPATCNNGHVAGPSGPLNESLDVYRWEYTTDDSSGVVDDQFRNVLVGIDVPVLRIAGDGVVYAVCLDEDARVIEQALDRQVDAMLEADIEVASKW